MSDRPSRARREHPEYGFPVPLGGDTLAELAADWAGPAALAPLG